MKFELDIVKSKENEVLLEAYTCLLDTRYTSIADRVQKQNEYLEIFQQPKIDRRYKVI